MRLGVDDFEEELVAQTVQAQHRQVVRRREVEAVGQPVRVVEVRVAQLQVVSAF